MYHRVLADDRFSHYYMNLFDPSNAFVSSRWGGLALRAVPNSPSKTPGNSKGTVFGGPKCSPISRICKEQLHEKGYFIDIDLFVLFFLLIILFAHLRVPSRMEHFVPSPFAVLKEQFESQVRVHFLLSRMEHFVPSPFAVLKEQFEFQLESIFYYFDQENILYARKGSIGESEYH